MKKFLTLILALSLVACFTACNNSSDDKNDANQNVNNQENSEITPEVKVMSHKEFVDAPLDSKICVETYIQAKQSWWEGKGSFYTQAEDGAYFIYDMPCTEDEYNMLTVGTKIRVEGYKSEWSGEVEITDAKFEIINGNYIAKPVDVTDLLGKDELINYQNELVSFKNMTVEAKKDADGNDVSYLYKWDGSGQDGDDLYFDVSYNNETYTFTVESYLCDNTTDVYKAVKNLSVGDKINMEGFLYWYEGANPHITAVVLAAE